MATVLFAERDPSFVQLAAMLSPTFAATTGPSSGGAALWPVIDLPDGMTNDDFVAEMHATHADGLDPEIVFVDTRDELAAAVRDADVLVTEREPIDAELLANARGRLRLVQKFGAWVPNIDVAAAAERGVMVSLWRRSANRRVAEHALLLMLGLVRRIVVADRSVRTHVPSDAARASRYTNNWVGLRGMSTLEGKTVGLVGLGEVGSELALLLKGLAVPTLYTQRNRNAHAEEVLGVEYRDLDDLLAGADIVSVHLPLNEQTTGFIGDRELRLMAPTSTLVNVSRGRLVDESALVDALRSGRLAGAAFDTPWREPLEPDHPLYEMDNVLLTPHVAAGAVDAELFRSEFSGPLENVARVLTGRLPLGVVNMPDWPSGLQVPTLRRR